MPRFTPWVLGVASITVCAVIWTAASVVKKRIFNDLSFDQPFALSVVANACYVVHFLSWGVRSAVASRRAGRRRRADNRVELLETPLPPDLAAPDRTWRAEAWAALLIMPVFFAGQWSYGVGLAMTSVTSSTVICTTSSVTTFLGSRYFLSEPSSAKKWLGVLLCIAGAVLLLQGDRAPSGPAPSWVGDLICWLSALFYSAYVLLVRALVRDPLQFFSFLGAYVLLLGGPAVALLLHFSPAYAGPFWASLSPEVLWLLLLTGLLDNALSQFFWAQGVLLTSPTVATAGLGLTIPLSVASDLLLGHSVGPWQYAASAVVGVGFLLVNLGHHAAKEEPADDNAAPLSETRQEAAGGGRQ